MKCQGKKKILGLGAKLVNLADEKSDVSVKMGI
jgi:hypothetical protein